MNPILCVALQAILFFNAFATVAFAQTGNTSKTVVPVENLLPGTFDIIGPSGSGGFGYGVLVLSNGNIVITDPFYDDGAVTDVGAVYLYSPSGTMISQLKGSTALDQVGSGIVDLRNGNFFVASPLWDNGAVVNAGAGTWVNGTTGLNGPVSALNSLVGTTPSDNVANQFVTPLSSGNFVVVSTNWDNGAVQDAGAATWVNGATGLTGSVSTANSLVGSTAYDYIGSSGITEVANGNYIVKSPAWDSGAIQDVGAATWANGTTGITGAVSAVNSLVGSTAFDTVGGIVAPLTNGNYLVVNSNWSDGPVLSVGAITWGNGTTGITGAVSGANSLIGSTAFDTLGSQGVTPLTNGNYVVSSQDWDNGSVTNAGAVTWGNGTTGITGVVSSSNSLVGSTASDRVGRAQAIALTNGNYVVSSRDWDNGGVTNVGAVTWGNGTIGITGAVSSSNSLVGSTASDQVGSGGVRALTNGNYVVGSSSWDNVAVVNAGAVTWGNGTTGISGVVSSSNSLVGSTANDQVGGTGVTALTNGNYVVRSAVWDNGAVGNAGAVTWGNGTTGISGVVSSANSLVGSTVSDQVGGSGVTALTNGNYVVRSSSWDNGAVTDAGAVTWGNGTTGISGAVSASNSLVGSTTSDMVGVYGVTPLPNGNYVIASSLWSSGTAQFAGAVTWANGTTGITGAVSPANSLVGSTENDFVGAEGVTPLTNGNYVMKSNNWDYGSTINAGAVTFGNGVTGTIGSVSTTNSVVGTVPGGGANHVVSANSSSKWAVGRGAENIVTILLPPPTAAGVKIEGTVVTSVGVGISRTKVTVLNLSTGASASGLTNSFGRFSFDSLPAGDSYVVTVESSGRYRFEDASRMVNLYEDLTDVVFRASR